jgi:hypothetical protein
MGWRRLKETLLQTNIYTATKYLPLFPFLFVQKEVDNVNLKRKTVLAEGLCVGCNSQ